MSAMLAQLWNLSETELLLVVLAALAVCFDDLVCLAARGIRELVALARS